MDNQRIIFVLLIVTVIFSIGSMVFVFSLNIENSNSPSQFNGETINSGNINFVLEENPNLNVEGEIE